MLYHDYRFITVAKMASHAIFQYNVLAFDDTHNIWTNMIVKKTILRLLGSSDNKEKINVARPEGPPLRGFRYPVSRRGSRGSRSSVQGTRIEETVKKSNQNEQDRDNLLSPVKPTLGKLYSSVQWTQKAETRVLRRMNRRCLKTTRRCNDLK